MFKIVQGIEKFFNTFQSKDTDTQIRAVKRLIVLAAAFGLMCGIVDAIFNLFE